MDWIYLSPHYDDAVLTCGGLIASQADGGEQVHLLTICGGDPPPGALSEFAAFQHARWNLGVETVEKRRQEDRRAARELGASTAYLSIPDAIYRRSRLDGRYLYDSEEAIFGPLDEVEIDLIADLRKQLVGRMDEGANLVCPLAIGGHVDHRLTRAAAEGLGLPLWYYADFPHAKVPDDPATGEPFPEATRGLQASIFPISSRHFEQWADAIAAYASQVPVLWGSEAAMRRALRRYHGFFGGVPWWRPAS